MFYIFLWSPALPSSLSVLLMYRQSEINPGMPMGNFFHNYNLLKSVSVLLRKEIFYLMMH